MSTQANIILYAEADSVYFTVIDESSWIFRTVKTLKRKTSVKDYVQNKKTELYNIPSE